MVTRPNENLYRRKVGATGITVGCGRAIHAFDSINSFFLIGEMIIPGSSYWNIGIGRNIGKVEQDEEGMKNMSNLGKYMAWLMKRIGN